MTLAFHNENMIKLLKTRGSYLAKESWKDVAAVNKKISQILKDQDKLDALQRPSGVYMLFNTEEGINRARKFIKLTQEDENFAKYRNLLGQPIQLKEACEPTDLIWENIHVSPATRRKAECWAVMIVGLLLALNAVIIFICMNYSFDINHRYEKVNCERINRRLSPNMTNYMEKAFDNYLEVFDEI